jgi:hypothetical protein
MLPAKSALTFWNKFPQIHNLTDPRRINHQSWAIDEVIAEYLDRLVDGNPDTEQVSDREIQQLPDAFWQKVWNRKKKHRRHRQIALTRLPIESGRPVVDAPEPSKSEVDAARNNPDAEFDKKRALELVQSKVTDKEWKLLWQHANGRPFEELSVEWGEPVGTLKSRAARCRHRLRDELPNLITD